LSYIAASVIYIGCFLQADVEGRTPLHLAAHFGCVESCRILTEAPNVDLDRKDSEGMTPLHTGVFSGYVAHWILRVLRAVFERVFVSTGKNNA
jgi:hypothetical protein